MKNKSGMYNFNALPPLSVSPSSIFLYNLAAYNPVDLSLSFYYLF